MFAYSFLRRRLVQTFFGWWIVAGAATMQALQICLFTQGYGLYLPILNTEFGWSTGVLGGAFALFQGINALIAPIQGRLLDRYGPRNVTRLGALMFGLGLIGFSQVTSLVELFAIIFVIAVGCSLGGFLSLTTVVVNWFEKRRTMALSVVQFGVSLGGLLLPILAWSLAEFGWRYTASASGIVILFISLPLTQLMRATPEEYGLELDGKAQPLNADAPVSGSSDFSAREAIRTRAFWYIAVGHSLAFTVVYAVNVHAITHMNTSLGYSLPVAAGVIAVMTGFTILGQFVGGILGDRYEKRIIAMLAMWFHVVGLLALTYASSAFLIATFAVFHGLGWGIRGPWMQAMRADYFGRREFGTIMGYSFFIAMLGTVVGPLVAGAFASSLGDYKLGFTLLAGAALFGSFLFFHAKPPSLLTIRNVH